MLPQGRGPESAWVFLLWIWRRNLHQGIQSCLAQLRQVHTVLWGQRSSGGRLQLITGMQNCSHAFIGYYMGLVQARAQEKSREGQSCVGTVDPRTKSQLLWDHFSSIIFLTFQNHLLCQEKEGKSAMCQWRGSAQSHVFVPHNSMHIFLRVTDAAQKFWKNIVLQDHLLKYCRLSLQPPFPFTTRESCMKMVSFWRLMSAHTGSFPVSSHRLQFWDPQL